ncbi:MAG TPA: twin-arginine translocation signal domain-containing protein [Gemmatimonadaceae bacterium]|nr:twin-arginine translocation signal domain-containing protein [Gemmatimonadaceae bacterium]
MSSEPLTSISRRQFLAAAGCLPLALGVACGNVAEPEPQEPGRLRLAPRGPTRGTLLGTDVVYGEDYRRAYIRVPQSYSPARPAPLIIALHGNGGRGDTMAAAFGSRTDALGAVVLAPDSLSVTWDAIEGDFGGDVAFINEVLDQTFDRCNIDAGRVALIGFSDGASYALSLGISNGDRLAGVVGFSPGFYEVDHPHGTPTFFISHGTLDGVLAIDAASRAIVPALRARGSAVTYVEFEGGHSVPESVADQAMAWLEGRGFTS